MVYIQHIPKKYKLLLISLGGNSSLSHYWEVCFAQWKVSSIGPSLNGLFAGQTRMFAGHIFPNWINKYEKYLSRDGQCVLDTKFDFKEKFIEIKSKIVSFSVNMSDLSQ